LTNYFLGFGEHVEILEPKILRQEYMMLIEKLLSRYKE
jgi:predicted DNA-binding transcriptional regulator YafY